MEVLIVESHIANTYWCFFSQKSLVFLLPEHSKHCLVDALIAQQVSLIANSYWCFCYIKKLCLLCDTTQKHLFKKRKRKLRLTLRVITFWNWGSFSAFSLGLPRAEMWFTLTDLRQFKPQRRVKTQKSESWSLCSCDLLSVKVMPGHYMYCILTYAKNCILTYAENSKL